MCGQFQFNELEDRVKKLGLRLDVQEQIVLRITDLMQESLKRLKETLEHVQGHEERLKRVETLLAEGLRDIRRLKYPQNSVLP